MKPKNLLKEKWFSYTATDDAQVLKFIKASREGMPADTFNWVQSYAPFSSQEWARFLQLSERTLLRYRQDGKPLEGVYAARVLEIMLLYKYGIEVFGNQEYFNQWLKMAHPALGGVQPQSFLDTTFGVSLLKDELTRIAHGITA